MNRLLVLSLALASIFGINAKQAGTVAAATVSEAEVVAPMSQRVPEVKAADPAREISFGYARAQAKAAGLKEVTGPAKAFYTRQKGMTYTGMSANSSSLSYSRMHILPNQDFTLKSLSTEAETLTWTISDGFTYDEECNVIGYTFRDISGETVTWHYDEFSSEIYCPILKASNSLGESTYQAADYLCTLPKMTSTTEGVGDFYKANVNPTAEIIAYWGVSACNSADANARLVSDYGLSEEKGYTDVNLYGLGEVYYYPGKPYLLTDVAAFVCDLVRDGNLKAKLEIYKVSFDEDDNLQIGELLTTATNDPSFIVSGRQFQSVVFNKLESESGETLIINSDIVVVVKPADTSTSYASYIYATIEDYPAQVSDLWNDFPSAYLLAGAKYNGNDVVIPISGAAAFYHGDAKTKLDVQRAFHIDINTTYEMGFYLSTDYYNAPIGGGAKTLSATATFPSSNWIVKTVEGYDVPEWITIKYDDKYNANNQYIGVTDIEIEVAPIIDGKSRECNIIFNLGENSNNVLIQQGEGPSEPLTFELNGIYYKKNYDGTSVSVTYKGETYDAYENEYVGDINIPSTIVYENKTYDVNKIGKHAFYGCKELTNITIPTSINTIDSYAFYNCAKLTKVNLPNNIIRIGNSAFYGCSSLYEINIPFQVSNIGYKAFYNCIGLKVINYDANNCNCTDIFNQGTSPESIIIGENVTSIPNNLFLAVTPKRVISKSITPPVCSESTFNESTYSKVLYTPSEGDFNYQFDEIWSKFSIINTLDKQITDIKLNINEATIKPGNSITLNAKVTPVDATIPNAIYWISSNTEVATVNQNGLVTAITEGDAIISVKSCDGGEALATCDISVKSFKATSITLNITELSLFEKTETATLKYTILPKDASVKTAEWVISDEAVIQYKKNADGSLLIGGKSAGTATVTARTTDGSNLSATCVVTVNPVAANVNQLKPGTNKVKFAVQGVKMHDGVLYACTTAKSVNMSTPTFHGNDANNMAPYEDRNFANFDQRDWVAISGLEEGFVGKELSYPFEATFADGVLDPSETIKATADATAYNLNTFRAENILHGGYSNYVEGDYTAYYVPARVNEVAKFMGLIETIGGVKYLYSNNAYGRKDGEGIKVDNCTITDNSKVYSILEGILVADASTKAGVKIIMLDYLGQATGVEGVDSAAARIYSANGNIIIAAAEDGEAAVYDYTGRLIKSVAVVAGVNTAVPVMPGCYIVRTGVKTQSVVVK